MERIRDFAAIDFETANGQRTSVCSVGVVVVRGGRPSESIYRLIRPYPNYYSAFTYGDPRSHAQRYRRVGRDRSANRVTAARGAQLALRRGVSAGCPRPLRTTLSRLPFPVYVERFAPSDQRVAQLSAPYGLRSLRIPVRTPPPCTGRRRSLCGDRPAAFRIAPRLIRTVRGFR